MAELAIDNGDPISGDQSSVQVMSTRDANSVVTEPTSNAADLVAVKPFLRAGVQGDTGNRLCFLGTVGLARGILGTLVEAIGV
eukprot:jgi/Psemu1/5306/gm1.5306_g